MSDVEERLSILETKIMFFEKTINILAEKIDNVINDTQYIKGKLIMLCDKISAKKNNYYMEIIKYLIVLIGAMVGVKIIGF